MRNRESDPLTDLVEQREEIFNLAANLLEPIIERHGLEKYNSGQMFAQAAIFTPVDQHLDHVIRLANWLMDKEG